MIKWVFPKPLPSHCARFPLAHYETGGVTIYFQAPLHYLVVHGLCRSGFAIGRIGHLYNVISYTVVQQTREIGVRMALGADRFQILKMTVNYGVTPALIGLVLGIAGAMVVTRLMASMFY